MDITRVEIRIINDDLHEFSLFKTVYPEQVATAHNPEADIVRRAHAEAARELDRRFPGQWCYANGIIDRHISLPEHADPHLVRGVGGINMIADGGFRGQFQWLGTGGGGRRVPAFIDIFKKPSGTDSVGAAGKMTERNYITVRNLSMIKAALFALRDILVMDNDPVLKKGEFNEVTRRVAGWEMKYHEFLDANDIVISDDET